MSNRPYRITLYAAAPKAYHFQPAVRSAPAGLRLFARRSIDMLEWRALGRFNFHWWNYLDRYWTNVGDIAIRDASCAGLASAFAPEPVQVDEVAWQMLTTATVDAINRNSDLFVISAGAYVHVDKEGVCAPWAYSEVEMLSRIQCPIATYGIGVSHKIHPDDKGMFPLQPSTKALLSRFVSLLTLCGVRDERTRQLLQDLAPPGRTIHLAPDPALTLGVPNQPPANLSGDPRIGLNLAFHGPHVEALLRTHFSTFTRFVKRLGQAYPRAEFYYFLHSEEERLLVRLIRSSGIRVHLVEGGPSDLLPVYSAMHIHIGQMLHSCLLSICAGTPPLALAYDTKHLEFFRSMGLERFCISPEDFSSDLFFERAVELIQRRDTVAAMASRARSEQIALHDSFLGRLRSLVDG